MTVVKNEHIASKARDFVLQLINQKANKSLVYHSFHQANYVVDIFKEVALAEGLSNEAIEVGTVAAWFCNIGYHLSYDIAENECKRQVSAFLDKEKYAHAQQVIKGIDVLYQQAQPQTKLEQVLSDALNAYHYTDLFEELSPLLRLELELVKGQYFSKADWSNFQLAKLSNAQFYTAFAKLNFEPIQAKNMNSQKELTYKSRLDTSSKETTTRPFQNLERKLPSSATQTFFRTNYRNHINLSTIADNKANIMISVNAILISVLISLVSYKNLTETNPMILMPVIIFLISGLTSLIFAVLSARPTITKVNDAETEEANRKKNIVFFGNFVGMQLEAYEEAMDAMFRDNELIYGNMTRDLYYLGQVLDKKYRLLTVSYNVFMLGFILTVVTFLIALI